MNDCPQCGKPFEPNKIGRPMIYCRKRCCDKASKTRIWYREVERLIETTCATLPPHARADADELPELDLMLLLV